MFRLIFTGMSDTLILPSMPFRSRSNCVSWWKQWCFAETTWHLDKKWSSATNWWSIWQTGSWETPIRSTLVIFVACPGMDHFYVWLFYSRLEHYLCKLDLFASSVQNCVVLNILINNYFCEKLTSCHIHCTLLMVQKLIEFCCLICAFSLWKSHC